MGSGQKSDCVKLGSAALKYLLSVSWGFLLVEVESNVPFEIYTLTERLAAKSVWNNVSNYLCKN